MYETARSQSRCLLPKPRDVFKSGVRKCSYGPEHDCFYLDLFKERDKQDKLSYDTADWTAEL